MLTATIISAFLATAQAAVLPRATTYTVTVGALGSWGNPDDTPAASYIDKDGKYYYQSAHALYGANDGRSWSFFSGSTMDDATKIAISTAANPANPLDSNGDTTWRCNNSPTGKKATKAAGSTSYAQANYCDLAGVWVDPDTGDWYGLVHNEFTPQPFGDGLHYDSIDVTVSRDQGKTWTITDQAITSPYSTVRADTTSFPGQTYYYGDGDPRIHVDISSGYFYVWYGSPWSTREATVVVGLLSTSTLLVLPSAARWQLALGKSSTTAAGPRQALEARSPTSSPRARVPWDTPLPPKSTTR